MPVASLDDIRVHALSNIIESLWRQSLLYTDMVDWESKNSYYYPGGVDIMHGAAGLCKHHECVLEQHRPGSTLPQPWLESLWWLWWWFSLPLLHLWIFIGNKRTALSGPDVTWIVVVPAHHILLGDHVRNENIRNLTKRDQCCG